MENWQKYNDLISKLEKRAIHHIHNLEEIRDEWRGDHNDRVSFEDDPQSGDRTYKVRDIPPIPEDFLLVAGDAIHNIRSSLDHLAHHLRCVAENSEGPFTDVYFPAASSPEKYESEASRKIKGLRDDAVKAINRIQPYGGGNGEILWHLHTLDIFDKHRLLIPTAAVNSSYSMAKSEVANLSQFLGPSVLSKFSAVQKARLFQAVPPAPLKTPLKRGDKLCTVPCAQINEHQYFVFDISFREPEVIAGKSVIDKLMQMYMAAYNVFVDFDNAGYLE